MSDTLKCPICGKDFNPDKIGSWEVEKDGVKILFILCPESDCILAIK